jgi:N-acetylglucosaminyldiphosphoundecaprenol N-acetyl-beta-D-mannosaminyltransferase
MISDKINILGVGVSPTSYDEVVAACAAWIRERAAATPAVGHYICVMSVHGIMEARSDSSFRAILNSADIVTPDGMPVVWALRSFGAVNQARVYGPNLMLALCASAEISNHRVFLYGGRGDTFKALCHKLKQRFPQLILAGAYSPPFRPLTDEEDEDVCRLITNAAPDIIFVGISTPKQETWMAGHVRAFPGMVMIGVGAAFDFHAGSVKQAPHWMQIRGLEWLFRLAQEPRRLWKRYCLVTPRFLPCWAMQKFSLVLHDASCGYAKSDSGPISRQ